MTDLTLSRRRFLLLASSVVAIAATPAFTVSTLAKIRPRFSSRKLSFLNIHTGEDFEGTYWREGFYDEKALERLSYILRDRRNNKQHPIDIRLFDTLHQLNAKLAAQDDPYQIICGYRSKETNAKLHSKSKGVAKNSLHVKGKAIDLRLEHTPLKDLCKAARSLKAGGVGYYAKSNFVHVDVRPKPVFWT